MMLTESGRIVPLAEAAKPAPAAAETAQRIGFDTDVPLGGTSITQPGGQYPDGRLPFLQQLKAAYLACPWLSAAIDVVARTVTAGGLQLTPDDDGDPGQQKPPRVQALQALLDRCNPQQDIIQLLRGEVTNLGIFADAFVEVVWLLDAPVALYTLDPSTIIVEADEHGVVTGYTQQIDTRTAHFEPYEIIHISEDSPHGSIYGVGVAQKALLPVEIWLFTAGLLKAIARKGNPVNIHVDFPLEVQQSEVRAWRAQYQVRNLGAANVGTPITSRGGATLNELQQGKIADLMALLDQCRDTIISEAGVPPHKVGIVESGNLGGGTGESQEKTFTANRVGPAAAIVLEKLNYHLTREAFGITGWSITFGKVDLRDDKIVEEIREKRTRIGAWSIDRYRVDIGEPPLGPERGGDTHAVISPQMVVLWEQMAEMAAAMIAAKNKPAALPPGSQDPAKTQDEPDDDTGGGGPDGEEPDQPPDDDDAEEGTRWRRSITEHYHRLLQNLGREDTT